MNPIVDEKYYYQNEYAAVRDYIASKAESLWKHDIDTKNHSISANRQVKFGIDNHRRWLIEDRVFYLFFDNIIKAVITTNWVDKVLSSLPKIAGDRCVNDIIIALEKTNNIKYSKSLEYYINLLKSSYGYIVEIKENHQNTNFNKEDYVKMNIDFNNINTDGIILDDKIFKIRLFDSIGEQKNKNAVKTWFNGGLFHPLKHFSFENVNIAGRQNKKGKRKLNSFCEIVRFYVITGLYFNKLIKSSKKDKFVSNIEWGEREKYKIVFYIEKNNGIYSLDSIIPQ